MDKKRYDNLNIILNPHEISYINGNDIVKKDIDVSVSDIRNQLNRIGFKNPYNYSTYKQFFSNKLENYNIPYMNFIYYYLFFKFLKIPTLEEFVNTYLYIYCNKINDDLYTIKSFFDNSDFSFTKNQLIGRVFRSYNSFHRELEFLFQMKEYPDINIEYNFQNDLNGIDFIVEYNNRVFGLASYIDSFNSNKWKRIKNDARHDYSNINMINVIAYFKEDDPRFNCKSYNGIYLYNPIYVAGIYFEIIKQSENKRNDEFETIDNRKSIL